MLTDEIKILSTTEKILLINDLWDDISESIETIPLTEEQKVLLDSRYEEFLNTQEEGIPWSELRQNLKKLL